MAVVYVFKSELGLVKIGRSKNSQKRMRQVSNSSGLRLTMEHEKETACAPAVEAAAHALLVGHRKCGEWFDVTVDEAIATIEQAVDQIGIPVKKFVLVNEIKTIRKRLRLTIRQFAAICSIRPDTLIRIENGGDVPGYVDMIAFLLARDENAIKQAMEMRGLL
jgi:DNA-binding XRE family transcriptional regulator